MLPGKELNRKVWHRDRTVKLRFERNWDGNEGERDLPDCDFELVWYVYHAHVTCFKSLELHRFGTIGYKPAYTEGFWDCGICSVLHVCDSYFSI